MFGSEWSLVLLRMKRGFTQNEAWFYSKWSVVLFKMKRGFYSRETSDSRQACHGLMTGLPWTHDRLAMNSRQACHELVERYLRSRTMNILIGRGLTFFKTQIVYLIIKDFWLFFLCFSFVLLSWYKSTKKSRQKECRPLCQSAKRF